jgi:hypothetical protein
MGNEAVLILVWAGRNLEAQGFHRHLNSVSGLFLAAIAPAARALRFLGDTAIGPNEVRRRS